MVGKPIDLMGKALPKGASQAIATATAKSSQGGFKIALMTIETSLKRALYCCTRHWQLPQARQAGRWYRSLPVEVPVSTIIMLRSILDIARGEGENLKDPESALSCVEVFGLGSRTEADDTAEFGLLCRARDARNFGH